MIDPKKIRDAMNDAPHDNKLDRQARAAIKAVLKELLAIYPDCAEAKEQLMAIALE